jgi:hypothetical protein
VYSISAEKNIAYPNAVDNFAKIDKVPVAMVNLDVGHRGPASRMAVSLEKLR